MFEFENTVNPIYGRIDWSLGQIKIKFVLVGYIADTIEGVYSTYGHAI